MRTLRPLLRKAAYRSGALGMVRSRLRRALTVVMFHRVMDPADPDFAASGMTGGAGGDCASGFTCRYNLDCEPTPSAAGVCLGTNMCQ